MKRPLMGAGIALVAGTAAALTGLPGVWTAVLAVVCGVCVLKWTESSLTYVLGLSVFLIVGYCRTLSGSETGEIVPGKQEIQGEVYKIQEKENSRWIYLKGGDNLRVLVLITHPEKSNEVYYKGQILRVSGEAEAFSHSGNPGQFDEKNYYTSQGLAYRLWAEKVDCIHEGGWVWQKLRVLEKLRQSLALFYRETMSESGAGVVMAAVLGDRSGFQADLRRYYQENGWIHLVTTSGLHLSFIAMGLYRRLRKSTFSILPSTAAALIVMAAYGYMTDFGDSMLRAMGMMILLLIGRLLGRKTDVPTAIVLVADVLLMLRPQRLMAAGFQLSFGAVIGVETGKYMYSRWKMPEIKGCLEKFQEMFWIQLGIFVVTLPVILWHMYEVPVFGFFYNFFMIPLVSLIVPAAFMAGLAGISPFGPLAGPASKVMWGIDMLLAWVHKLPSKTFICGRPQWRQICFFILLCGLVVFLERSRFTFKKLSGPVLIFLACFLLMAVRERADRIVCVDVGQGDGICILSESGHAILVDGGSSDVKKVYSYRIEPMLKYYGVRKIDAWFLTHGDSDHVSGIEEALGGSAVPMKQIILPDISGDETLDEIRALAEKKAIPVREIHPGDWLAAGNFRLDCLYPEGGNCAEDKNNASLVLSLTRKMKTGNFVMLLMGDLEKEGEEALLREKTVPDCNVLKVGHHGSSGATSDAFLAAALPEWAFISCGEDNRYGHPHDETLERLRGADCQYLTTARQGALGVIFSSGGYRIYAWQK